MPITIVVDNLESTIKTHAKTQSKPLYFTSTYENFCVEKVLDAKNAVSNRESNAQCCDCMIGFICFPFLPAMCIYDMITYPIRRLGNCYNNRHK